MNASSRRKSGKWGSEEARHYVSTETKDDNCWSGNNSETDYEKVPRSNWDSAKGASSHDSKMSNHPLNSKNSSGLPSRLSSHEDRREQNVKNHNGDINNTVQISRTRGGDPSYDTSLFPSRFDRGHQNRSRSPKGSWSRSHRSRSRTPPSSFRDEMDEYNGRTGKRSQGRVLPREEFMSERVNQEYETKRYFQPQRDQSRDRVTLRYNAYYDDDRESDEDPRSNRSASLRGQLIRGSSYRDDHHSAFVESHGREISEIHDAYRYESFGRDRSESHGSERYGSLGKDRSESHGRERYESIDRERSESHGRERSYDRRDTHLSFKQEHGCDGPHRSYATPCKFFLSGNCRNGENCRFSHESVARDNPDARFGSSTQQSNMGNGSRSGGGPRWKDISPDPTNNAWEVVMDERKNHSLTDQNRSRRWSNGRCNNLETAEGSSLRSSVDNGQDRSQGCMKWGDDSPEAANGTSLRNSMDDKQDRSDRWQKWKGNISEAAGRSQGWPDLGDTTSEVAGQDGPQAWPKWGDNVPNAAGQGSQGWPKWGEDASEAQSDGQDKYANSNNREDSTYSCKAPETAEMILPEKSLDDKQSKNWGDDNSWEGLKSSCKASESAQMILTEKESSGDKQSKTWGGDKLFLEDSGLNTTDTIPEAMLVDVELDDKPFIEVSGPSEWIEKENVSVSVFESHVDGNRLSVANVSPAGIKMEQFHHFIDISDTGKVHQGSQSRSSVDMSTSVICQGSIIQEAFPCNDRDCANISSSPLDVNGSILGKSVVSEYHSAPNGYNQNHQEKGSSFGSGGQGFDLNEPIQQIIHQSSSNSHHEVQSHSGEPFESDTLQVTDKKVTTQSSVTSGPVENLNSSNSSAQNLQKLYPTLYSPNIKVSVPPSLTFAEQVASVYNSIQSQRHSDANGGTTMLALPETLVQQSSLPKKAVEQNKNTVQESQTQDLPWYPNSNETVVAVSTVCEDQYSPITGSIDLAPSIVVNNHPSKLFKKSVEQLKNVVLTSDNMDLTQFSCQSPMKPQEQLKTNMLEPKTRLKNAKSSPIAGGNSIKSSNMHGVVTEVNCKSKPTVPIVGEKLVSCVTRMPNIAQSVNGDSQGGDNSIKGKESKALRNFKFALAEFTKELLKPAWKDGQVSKEAHKTIVKKVVDKVCSTVQGDHIPQTTEKIDFYLTFSKPKLTKLVQAYVERGKQPKA